MKVRRASRFAPKLTGFGDIEVDVTKALIRHAVDVLWFRHGRTPGHLGVAVAIRAHLGHGQAVVVGVTPFGRNFTCQARRVTSWHHDEHVCTICAGRITLRIAAAAYPASGSQEFPTVSGVPVK